MIDADDTLWENNVFFEKLIEDFITLVESCGYTRAYIRHILNETERKNIRQYGYGVRSFGRSLEETYLKLADQMVRRETLAQIHGRVMELERTPPKILDGVPETLAYLTERHRLILFTKGEPAEQAAKVERSAAPWADDEGDVGRLHAGLSDAGLPTGAPPSSASARSRSRVQPSRSKISTA